MADERAYLGRGWRFPLELTRNRDVELSEYERDVDEAIRLILGTNRGERVMRDDFGAGLDQFIFASVSANTLALIRHRVEEALVTWEPRIDVKEVQVTRDSSQRGLVLIDVRYLIRSTNTFYNLVYPFHIQEGNEVADTGESQ